MKPGDQNVSGELIGLCLLPDSGEQDSSWDSNLKLSFSGSESCAGKRSALYQQCSEETLTKSNVKVNKDRKVICSEGNIGWSEGNKRSCLCRYHLWRWGEASIGSLCHLIWNEHFLRGCGCGKGAEHLESIIFYSFSFLGCIYSLQRRRPFWWLFRCVFLTDWWRCSFNQLCHTGL